MEALDNESQHQQPSEPTSDLLEALVEEIAEDAAALAGRYSRDVIVPEGGE